MARKFGKKVFSLGDIFTFRSKKINKTSKKRKKSKLEIKKKTGPINKKHKCNDKHLDEIMNRRFGLIIVLLISIYLASSASPALAVNSFLFKPTYFTLSSTPSIDTFVGEDDW